mgnify:CR=1 FL=1
MIARPSPQSGNDGSAQSYASDKQRRLLRTRHSYAPLIEANKGKFDAISFVSEPTQSEEINLWEQELDFYIKENAKKNTIIQELESRLAELECVQFFRSSSPKLPDDYYENDAYLDR